jgi:hypothetical protein
MTTPSFYVYVLNTEQDIQFYPNKFVVITNFADGRVIVELLSGPGPENVLTMTDRSARDYLLAMKLHPLH